MKISSVELTVSAVRRSQYPEIEKPEFMLVGRSNVGKSSFINTLIHRKNFARTSSTPGKTQNLNFYLVNDGIAFEGRRFQHIVPKPRQPLYPSRFRQPPAKWKFSFRFLPLSRALHGR